MIFFLVGRWDILKTQEKIVGYFFDCVVMLYVYGIFLLCKKKLDKSIFSIHYTKIFNYSYSTKMPSTPEFPHQDKLSWVHVITIETASHIQPWIDAITSAGAKIEKGKEVVVGLQGQTSQKIAVIMRWLMMKLYNETLISMKLYFLIRHSLFDISYLWMTVLILT